MRILIKNAFLVFEDRADRAICCVMGERSFRRAASSTLRRTR